MENLQLFFNHFSIPLFFIISALVCWLKYKNIELKNKIRDSDNKLKHQIRLQEQLQNILSISCKSSNCIAKEYIDVLKSTKKLKFPTEN